MGTGTEQERESSSPVIHEGVGKEEEVAREEIELREAVGEVN
jgi:hypothetical protein